MVKISEEEVQIFKEQWNEITSKLKKIYANRELYEREIKSINSNSSSGRTFN